jgi:hypothetical protein
MLDAGLAYNPVPVPAIAAPQPTEDLRAWLWGHQPLPRIAVQCQTCGYRLDKWEELGGHIMPAYQRPARFGSQGGVAYTERLAAGHGPIIDSYTADARGTIVYGCPRCLSDIGPRRNTSLRAETRLQLFLQALLDNANSILI